jgi:DNA-binding response OmpR family regulator
MVKPILVVEEDEDVLAFVQAVFESEGYRVNLFLQNEQNDVSDLILLDVLIKHEVRGELSRQLKRRGSTQPVRLILFSAHITVSQVLSGTHVAVFPAQPCYMRELLDTVKKYTRAPCFVN